MHLLVPEKLISKLPLSPKQAAQIDEHRNTIKNLCSHKDPRLALVFGPCSIHDLSSALEYARRFRALAEDVKETFFCVMRVYVEKPRTSTGWKGLVYDPHLDGSSDLQTGLFWARELFLTLTDLGIPIATELLHPLLTPFYSDLMSWGFIGARTSASQPHRELASSLPFTVGFKNSTEGNVGQAIQAMVSARQPHRFPSISLDGKMIIHESTGNPCTHVVLRGSFNSSNYHPEFLSETTLLQSQYGIKSRILVDCSHGNCNKNYRQQKEVFEAVLEQRNESLLGMMLESHLEEGTQPLTESPSSLHYGVSVTDPCLGWEDTASLIREASSQLSSLNVIN